MKQYLLLFLFLITTYLYCNSQNVPLCLGQDATICSNQTVTITNCNSGGNANNAAGLYLDAPTIVTLTDDVWSGAVNIGFTFSFYGQNYTQCLIGSNGLLSFNLAQANQYCPWSLTGGPLPNTIITGARNSAMLTYQDINPSIIPPAPAPPPSIQYQTLGTAPNRKFVVLYKDVYMFSCTAQCNYMSIVLYESSNDVEFHIGNKPQCPGWNSGLAIQGTENNAMTVATTTPGRNNQVWGANQDGRRFSPTSPTNTSNYTTVQIPYLMVNSPGSNFVWNACNAAGTVLATFPYNNGVLNLPSTNPNYQIPQGTSGYFLSGSACGTSIGSITGDTTWITVANPSLSATSTPDICSQDLGTVTAVPGTNSPPPYTFSWPTLASSLQTVENVGAGTYTVFMTDGNGCTANTTVTVGDTPANFSPTTTLISCPGGSNGTATATMTPVLGTVTYLWSDGQTTQTATNLIAGTYTCIVTSSIGCSGTVTAVVNEIPPMVLTISNQTDVTCNSGSDGTANIDVTQGTSPYTFVWDISLSISGNPTDLNANVHTVTVTDANNCVQNIQVTIDEPAPLVITSLTPNSMICPGTPITLDVVGNGGSSPYIYTWNQGGTIVGTGSSVTVEPNSSGTQYCVTLSEQCGSPTTQQCMTVTFPTEINANASPDQAKDCIPGEFTLSNTSSNSGNILSTEYIFSNGDVYNLNGSEDVTVTFPNVGVYDVQMSVTSNFGCVYTTTINNIVEVTPVPTADFTISKNPATWFETTIQTSDISQGNIINWVWTSAGAETIANNGGGAILTYPEGQVGTYPITLTVTTGEGCSDSITLEIDIVPDIILYVPNSFTPDDDEHNQTWLIHVEGIDLENFKLEIFNRWGEIIWESCDAKERWNATYNGSPVQAGTYMWRISYKLKDVDDRKYHMGYINVIR